MPKFRKKPVAIEKMAEALRVTLDMCLMGNDDIENCEECQSPCHVRLAHEALAAYKAEKGKYTTVITERLEVILNGSCPPHRKDIHKPCSLVVDKVYTDCAECREAYLTGEGEEGGS